MTSKTSWTITGSRAEVGSSKSMTFGFIAIISPESISETIQESYQKEYGGDTIESHTDAINENDGVLLHDDLLATGGTMKAACDLVKKFNPKKVYCNFIIELHSEFPNSRDQFDKDIEITSLLQF